MSATRRSRASWRGRPSGSRTSARATPRVVGTATPVALEVPDRSSRSAGTLIEASIRARLLGLRLLTLDATVVLVPAAVTAAAVTAPPAAVRDAAPRTVAVGRGLADAVRRIDEGAALLAEARRNGS